jgi:hypothetical protein
MGENITKEYIFDEEKKKKKLFKKKVMIYV